MIHPPISELLGLSTGSPLDAEIAAHLAGCAVCRRLVGLAEPVRQRELAELVTVDAALYHGREPLPGGRGGMGVTRRAWDRRLGRDVVIKELGDVASQDARARLRARFIREAQITARLAHPGIVGVLELGAWPDGEPFYTMPLVSGEPLDRAIATRTTFEARLALLPRLLAAAETIAYAHDRGVVHRDLKPANMLLGAFGETLVIDWGLARELDNGGAPDDRGAASDGAPDLTVLGVGTPAYMPPEQARGEEPTFAMDVYALGATLYHLLAGRPPYAGDAATARASLLAGPPPSLHQIAPDTPPDLAAIVTKAMAREPADRFSTALELAAELRRFLTGQLTRTHRYRPGELLRHWLRRHRTALRIGALALGVLAVLGTWSVVRVVRERDRASRAYREAETRRVTAENALAGSRATRASLLAKSSPARRLEALELVASTMRVDNGSMTTEIEQGIADVLAAGPIAIPLATPGQPAAVAFSPDGALAVTTDVDAKVRAWNGHDASPRGSISLPFEPLWTRFVDRNRVAVWGLDSKVVVWSVGRDHGSDVLELASGTEPWTLFAQDGTQLVTAGGRGELRVWSDAGQRVADTNVGCRPAVLVAAAGLVVAACERGVVAWEHRTGRLAWIIDGRDASQLTADTQTLCTVLDMHEVACTPMAAIRTALTDAGPSPSLRTVFADPTSTVYHIDLLPDGHAITVATGIVWTVDLATLVARDLGHELEARPPRGPRWAGFSIPGPTIAVLDTAVRDAVLLLHGHQPFERTVLATRPDGARVLAGTAAGETWLWDTRLGTEAGVLPEFDVEIVALQSDGDRVLIVGLDGRMTIAQLDGVLTARDRAGSEVLAWNAPLVGTRDGSVRVIGRDGLGVSLLHGTPVSALATRADGARALSGSLDGSVVAWDLDTGRERLRLPAGGEAVSALAYLDDRLMIARSDGRVELRSDDGTLRGSITLAAAVMRAITLSRDRIALATEAGEGTLVQIVHDGLSSEPLAGAPLARSTDGMLALTSVSGIVSVRDPRGQTREVARLPRPATHAAFSPDGTTLWIGNSAGAIQGIALVPSRPSLTFDPGELGAVTALTISENGDWLLAGYAHGAVRAFPATPAATHERLCGTLRSLRRPLPTACASDQLTGTRSTTSSP